MMGMHLTTPRVHSSHRTVTPELSASVALFGHFGIEWDLTTTDAATRERIAAWVALAKRIRPLIATGAPVHTDLADGALDARGIVAADRSSAVFVITQATTSSTYPPAPVRLTGLSPESRYRLRLLPTPGDSGQSALEWPLSDIVMTGRALASLGVRPPALLPQQAAVIDISLA
jgi:alpha-galactosidase